jgi:hypothetical protein
VTQRPASDVQLIGSVHNAGLSSLHRNSRALLTLRSARALECLMKPRDILIKTFGIASL